MVIILVDLPQSCLLTGSVAGCNITIDMNSDYLHNITEQIDDTDYDYKTGQIEELIEKAKIDKSITVEKDVIIL